MDYEYLELEHRFVGQTAAIKARCHACDIWIEITSAQWKGEDEIRCTKCGHVMRANTSRLKDDSLQAP